MRDKVKFSVIVSSALLAAALTGCSSTTQPTTDTTAIVTATDGRVTDPRIHQDEYPDEYNSYISASSKDFDNPLHTGKPNAVADLENGPNEPQAYCLNCHSTDMQLLMDSHPEFANGEYVDARNEISGQSITCYTCHGDTPGEMTVGGSSAVRMALESTGVATDTVYAACAQCHGVVDHEAMKTDPDISTWSTLTAGTDPEDVWALFQSRGIDTPDVAQNQYNIFQGSTHDDMGATCADCHMETMTADDGTEYKNHVWQTVDENPEIFNNCLNCHGGTVKQRKAALKEVQEEFEADTSTVQAEIDNLSSMVESSNADDTTIEEATALLNESSFYLQYTTDNSMGFHGMGNKGMVKKCLALATEKADDGMNLLS